MAVKSQRMSSLILLIILVLVQADIEYAQHGNPQGTPSKGPHYDHYGEGHAHNVEFDHEAILGSHELNEEFSQLPPHEAKKRLADLLLKMDINGDQKIAKGELTAWILSSFRKQEEGYAVAKLVEVDLNQDNKVSWSEYLSRIYGYTLEEMDKMENDSKSNEELKTFVEMVNDDKEKFRLADRDKNGMLSVHEYVAFLYPHSYPFMHDHEIKHTLKALDKNNDSAISFDEYLGESKPSAEQLIIDRDNFNVYDLNRDGKLDRQEIKNWVMPDQKSIAEGEATHLIQDTDMNKDGVLSKEEILDRYDLWVGSAATDYGHRLQERDEL